MKLHAIRYMTVFAVLWAAVWTLNAEAADQERGLLSRWTSRTEYETSGDEVDTTENESDSGSDLSVDGTRDPKPRTVGAGELIVNTGTFSIEWKSKTCKLGNYRPFHLFRALHGKLNTYVSYHELIEQVWGGVKVEDNTIHKTAGNLKTSLDEAGMGELEIRPQAGHYGLFLP